MGKNSELWSNSANSPWTLAKCTMEKHLGQGLELVWSSSIPSTFAKNTLENIVGWNLELQWDSANSPWPLEEYTFAKFLGKGLELVWSSSIPSTFAKNTKKNIVGLSSEFQWSLTNSL